MTGDTIRWPTDEAPQASPVHVVNRVAGGVATELVWRRLVHAAGWPAIYANAHDVRIEGGGTDLFAGARFRWRTFGIALQSDVVEFEPERRIAWSARGIGVRAYHAWLLIPTGDGCDVLTEETQHGPVARAGRWLFPTRMERWHQRWLEALVAPG